MTTTTPSDINPVYQELDACDESSLCDAYISKSRYSKKKVSKQKYVESRIEKARQRCLSLDIRFTKLREQVYRIVTTANKPLGAYEIISLMQEEQNRTTKSFKVIAPPTIYRSLQFLLEHGFVHQLVSINAFVPCCHPRYDHAPGFLICQNCQRVQEYNNDLLSSVLSSTETEMNFQIASSVFEISGLCTECQSLNCFDEAV